MTTKQRRIIKRKFDVDIPKRILATSWIVSEVGDQEKKAGAKLGDLCLAVYKQNPPWTPAKYKESYAGKKGVIYYFFDPIAE